MISRLKRYRLRYLLKGSKVIVEPGGILQIDPDVQILNSVIYVGSGGTLKLASNSVLRESTVYIAGPGSQAEVGSECSVSNADLAVWKGRFVLGSYSFIENGGIGRKVRISIDGSCVIGTFNRIRAALWVRFGGVLSIGSRNAINERTEIRCDEQVDIGDYNQISYECTIWDTNTHCLYHPERRREVTDSQYPDFGFETERPLTSPVKIGSDCWLGKGSTLLKGSVIEDRCVVGYGTLISGKHISAESKVVSKSVLSVSPIESWE